MFEFIDVERKFQEDFWSPKKVVLDKLSFKVEEGSLCGFLGANGSGKTTSLKAFFKFINIDSGEIRYSKTLGKNWKEIRNNIGYFPERPYFYPSMTGRDFSRYIFNLGDGKDFDMNLNKWSEQINIKYALDQKIKNYSKGMLQRLGFLTSIISNPKLIILDEPLSGLDPIGRRDFKEVMRKLNSEGVTIFFSSHIVSDVEEVCQDIIIIDKGKASFCGKVESLFNKDQNSLFSVVVAPKGNICDLDTLKTFSTQNKLIYGTIDEKEKNLFLRELLDKEMELVSMSPYRRTLEKIVYSDVLK